MRCTSPSWMLLVVVATACQGLEDVSGTQSSPDRDTQQDTDPDSDTHAGVECEVEVTSPQPEHDLYADLPTNFAGQITAMGAQPDELTAGWSSSRDGDLGAIAAFPTESGRVSGIGFLSSGDQTLTLAVFDDDGRELCRDQVQVLVRPENRPPDCAIVEPAEGEVTAAGQPTRIRVAYRDPDQGPQGLSLDIESSSDGGLLYVSETDATGAVDVSPSLSTGRHRLSAAVTDSFGQTCQAVVWHDVLSPDASRR